jgi:hypothetical protein
MYSPKIECLKILNIKLVSHLTNNTCILLYFKQYVKEKLHFLIKMWIFWLACTPEFTLAQAGGAGSLFLQKSRFLSFKGGISLEGQAVKGVKQMVFILPRLRQFCPLSYFQISLSASCFHQLFSALFQFAQQFAFAHRATEVKF